MDAWLVFTVAVSYILVLFGIAMLGDKLSVKRPIVSPALVYSLSLAVYCTSWTYYGAVGTASTSGLEYTAIYLSPILLFIFGLPLLRKIVRTAKRQNIASIADYLSARYGKRSGIAALVTVISTIAIVPYISLQLKAVSTSIEVLTQPIHSNWAPAWFSDTTFLTSIAMTIFAILFGTRQVDASEHHPGLMLAIAFESMVKLLAFIAIGLFTIIVFFGGLENFWLQFHEMPILQQTFSQELKPSFWTQMLLAAGAIICLPRQFHIMVVENISERHLKTARWVFPSYLVIVTLMVIPITSAGLLMFPEGKALADTFVLRIPMESGNSWLSLLVFVGGFSAATAMIVIATLSLSTMISNDVVLPFMLRLKRPAFSEKQDFAKILILIRRLTIVGIILMGYGYHKAYGSNEALSTIGLIAFSLVVQLVPAVLGAIYWKKASAWGVYAGLTLGSIVWFFTLMLPALIEADFVGSMVMEHGLFGLNWLRPEQLFYITFDDPLTHGVFWSLFLNILSFFYISTKAPTRLIDRLQAAAFVDQTDPSKEGIETSFRRQNVTVSDIRALLEQFAGVRRAGALLADFERSHHVTLVDSSAPKLNLVRYIERVMSGIIGTSSARAMVHSVLLGRSLAIEEVVTFFDETTQALQFNQKLLSTTLENIDQGVSVVDRDLKLVAWNRRYVEMFDYEEGYIRSGRPVEDLVRYNAERGECGPGDIEDHVSRRLEHLRKGSPHRFIRVRKDGTVVEMKGNPLPGGGFVTTFNDISEHNRAKEALQQSKQQLEIRVEERTRTIQEMNHELREEIVYREEVEKQLLSAKADAESANASKTRFLALASHDILQPLNAARLYTASLFEEAENSKHNEVVGKLNDSLQATEELISTLLEIARLDDGALQPKLEDFNLNDIVRPLVDELSFLAAEKSIKLHYRPCNIRVHSDPVYLRRIVQNLVSNALKYTQKGRVFVGVKKQGSQLLIRIYDTGPGISPEDQEKIFSDFYRIAGSSAKASGVGLGLGVVSRLSALLNHPIRLNSVMDKGSLFELTVPISEQPIADEPVVVVAPSHAKLEISDLRVLCVDNQPENLAALETLLSRWGCTISKATRASEALAIEKPDLILMDYQLDFGEDGITLYQQLTEHWGAQVPAILITANAETSIRNQAIGIGMSFLRKPVKPAPLRTLINSILRHAED